MKNCQKERTEEGIEIPVEQVAPDTLQRMVEEFVTREWEEPGGSSYTLEEKVEQVLRQLHCRSARIMYDVTSETWNIVAVN